MNLSDFNPTKNSSALISGESLSYNDLIYLDAFDGKGRKVTVSNYAAVGDMTLGSPQSSSAAGLIVAQTQISAAAANYYSRCAALINDLSEIFALTYPFTLNKFTSDGNFVNSTDISSSGVWLNHHALKLSNGNIACISQNSGISFAVLDRNLSFVKNITAITNSINNYFAAIALSGGGFAVIYQDNISPLTAKIATFDNSGNAVLSPTTIWTRTGTTGAQYHKAVQLSNGNIAIAISSTNTSGNVGLFYGVITTGGSSVLAFTLLDATSSAWFPEIEKISGYFAISRPNSSNQKAYVFNNAGVLQGSEFSAATTAGNAGNKTKLLSDGTNFWLIWHRSSDSKCVISILPVTGSGYLTYTITISPTQYNSYLDAFYENGLICAISMLGTGNSPPVIWIVSTINGSLVNAGETRFGVGPSTTNGFYPRVIPGGDRTFIAMYDYTSTAATNLYVGKYSKTAVIGVAQNSASAGSVVSAYSQAGAYVINKINGNPANFDHSANSIPGNKGAMLQLSVTLKGLGV